MQQGWPSSFVATGVVLPFGPSPCSLACGRWGCYACATLPFSEVHPAVLRTGPSAPECTGPSAPLLNNHKSNGAQQHSFVLDSGRVLHAPAPAPERAGMQNTSQITFFWRHLKNRKPAVLYKGRGVIQGPRPHLACWPCCPRPMLHTVNWRCAWLSAPTKNRCRT